MKNNLLAQQISNPVVSNGLNQVQSPQAYFNTVIQAVFNIFFIVGVIYFIWHFVFAGYHYIASDGDPKKIETSKNELTYGLLGLLIIFSVYAVLRVVGLVTGITGLSNLSIPWPSLVSP